MEINIGVNKKRIKGKIYFLLTQIIIAMLLGCACSAQEPPQASVPAAPQSGSPAESVLSGLEEDIAETKTKKTDAAAKDTAQIDAPEDEMSLPLQPDLNRNGIAEEVCLKDIDGGQELEIWENGKLVDREIGYFSHAGQTSVFLCTLDGEDYLLRYHPTMYQGVGSYGYALSTLIDNEETVVRWNEIDFDINFGSLLHDRFEAEAIATFMDEINELFTHSVQLLNTENDLLDTFEKEGRLYDSLWWLDGWEPEFVRDEHKSLQENLEAFRDTMTAVPEPPVSEEVDGLPITEPLELLFYSGAGAWDTHLFLQPDGSFVAYYHDADGYTIYVCPFFGRFGKVEKLTDASWLLTLESLERDTERSVGEEWDEEEGDHTIHYIASEPYGFTDADEKALKTGAQFILYSPEATGHEPDTELYGAERFQSWMHERREFTGSDDTLGCWGLHNLETGEGFFDDSNPTEE